MKLIKPVIERHDTVSMSVRMKSDQYDRLYAVCMAAGISMSAAIRQIIDNIVNERSEE